MDLRGNNRFLVLKMNLHVSRVKVFVIFRICKCSYIMEASSLPSGAKVIILKTLSFKALRGCKALYEALPQAINP